MKKLNILSLAALPLAMAMLASCGPEDPGTDPGTDPESEVTHTVTKEEWVAAFNTEKVFGFADNFKLSMNLKMGESLSTDEFIIDGLKMKDTAKSGENTQEFYYSSEGDEFYRFYTINETWVKQRNGRNPSQNYKQYLEPFSPNYESFAYNEESQSYKCETFEYEGTTINNLELKFDNKQIVFAKLDAQMSPTSTMAFDATISYGGQSVTLPTVHEHSYNVQKHDEYNHWMECACGDKDYDTYEPHIDALEDGFCDVCGAEMGGSPIPEAPMYALEIGGIDNSMSYDSDNELYICENVLLNENEQATVKNVTPGAEGVLTDLSIDGYECGFSIDDGILTASATGLYTFKLSVVDEIHKISILDVTPVHTGIFVMGGVDEFAELGEMNFNRGSETEYALENVTIEAGMSIKVKNGPGDSDYCETFKKDVDNPLNAFKRGVCVMDNGNAKFLFDANVSIYYESAQEGGQGYGVFVYLNKVISPYSAVGSCHGQSASVSFEFDKVESGVAQYIANIPEGYVSGEFTYSINKGQSIAEVTIEQKAEGAFFVEIGETNTYAYNGAASALVMYLKENLSNHELSLYVEEYVDPALFTTLYLAPGVWTNDGATFYAYFFESTSGKEAIWVPLTQEDDLYKVEKVDDYEKVIFVRCDPAKDPLADDGWAAKWNQTDNQDVPTNANVKCTIIDWGEQGENSPVSWGTK